MNRSKKWITLAAISACFLLPTVPTVAAETDSKNLEGTEVHSAEFRTRAFHGVIGDNAAGPNEHAPGFNGLWSLVPAGMQESMIGRQLAGLNLEHYINGTDEDGKAPEVLFDPRRSPMEFKQLSDSRFLLYQPPTKFFQVESWTEFTVREPNIIDMSFRCIPHKEVFPNGWLGVFWATYVEAPEEPAAHFLGYETPEAQSPKWLTTDGTQMVYGRTARVPLKFPGPMRGHAMATTDPRRWAEPFYYAVWRDRAYIVMFDTDHDLGMYAGRNRTGKGWNPWDFQMIIHKPAVGARYELNMRMVVDRFKGKDWIMEKYREWRVLRNSE
jgi:hypothetical protein